MTATGTMRRDGAETTMIRSKMTCTQANESDGSIVLEPVISGSAENEKFFEYTPGGSLALFVVRPETVALMKPGAEYYVDITPAE